MCFINLYEPTLKEYLVIFGGVAVVLLVGYLVTKYTKYGGGSNYGVRGDDNIGHDPPDFD